MSGFTRTGAQNSLKKLKIVLLSQIKGVITYEAAYEGICGAKRIRQNHAGYNQLIREGNKLINPNLHLNPDDLNSGDMLDFDNFGLKVDENDFRDFVLNHHFFKINLVTTTHKYYFLPFIFDVKLCHKLQRT
ncbi:MAG: hypothetical protein QCH31_09330 [Methanolobus sp.]|nr:hypothetical protein [Methanolobus sp.]